MSSSSQSAHRAAPNSPSVDGDLPLSGDRPEFTLRAVLIGILVATFIGFTYPQIVLRLGFGPNMSVVSAFLGFIIISIIGKLVAKKGNRFEYNIVQTAGTAAGQQGFMVIVLAAFDLLAAKPELGTKIELSTLQIFLWLTTAGALGVLLAVPLRKHYIDEEKLTFADGTAAGETLILLDTNYRAAKRGIWALTIGGLAGFIHTLTSQAARWRIFPEQRSFGEWGTQLHLGTSWSLLSVASGMLVGLRVTVSMGLGMAVWFFVPDMLKDQGIITAFDYRSMLRWIMWPALGLMVSGGLTALALKWKLIVRTFKDIKVTSIDSTDFPIKWVAIGSVVLSVALIALQKIALDQPVWLSVAAILISIPVMLVGTRVLGETNWAPISTMANMVQVFFAGLAPGNIAANMFGSGMSGTVAANGEHLMQDYKAGKLIGSNNRYLTYMQLIALPFGALAVAIVYPLLKAQKGIGPDRYGLAPEYASQVTEAGLSAPASVRWAGMAEALSKGLDQLPQYALWAFAVGCVLGIVFTLLEGKSKWIPSATSMGLGMLIEGYYVLAMVIGGVIQHLWSRANPKQEGELAIPLSSGVIVGEAFAVLAIVLLTLFSGLFTGVTPAESLISTDVWGAAFFLMVAGALWFARKTRGAGDLTPPRSGGGH